MIYLSHFLDAATPAYDNDQTAFNVTPDCQIAKGDSANTLRIAMSNHVGTHIDFPRHFDDSGKVSNDFAADFWRFEQVQLLDIPCEAGYLMKVSDLEGRIEPNTELLLVRTGFEARRDEDVYWHNNPAMDVGVGKWLREHFPKLRAFGFDSISMSCLQQRKIGGIVHREFLSCDPAHDSELSGTPILIIEDMKLAHVTRPLSWVIVAPLQIAGADGAQVTVFAEEAS